MKGFDTLSISKNKCAYDFSKKIVPYLKKWKPLQKKGKTYAGIAKFPVKPFYIYHSNINPNLNKSTDPIFSKGMNQFRNYMVDIFSSEIKKNKETYYILTFILDENGSMKNIEISVYPEEELKNKEFLIAQVLKIRGSWKPALFNKVPAAISMRLPMSQEFDMSWEKQIQEDKFKSFQSK